MRSLIDLRKGHPKPRNLPHSRMALAMRRAAARLEEASEAGFGLCYTPGSAGSVTFLPRLASFLSAQYGTPCLGSHLFTTNGVSHGIEMVCATLTAPGDTIWLEEASYFLAYQIFADHRLIARPVPSDERGLDTDALDRILTSGALGPPPKLMYLIPSHGNPSGATLPIERRSI
mmetsp:Transcript_6155/g.18888  ORF Transcript_6155/g.18888 Transcript_6155/m.18888 type:complete len:174 (+) Transcript_6155:161-682(+)